MSVSYECCVLAGRGLCDRLITRPEESYRMWCVVACDLETSRQRRLWPARGRSTNKKLQYDFEVSLFIIIITMLHSSVRQNITTRRTMVCNTAAKGRGKRVVRDVSKVQKEGHLP